MVISWFLTIENSLNELLIHCGQRHRLLKNSWVLVLVLVSNFLSAQSFKIVGTVKNAEGVKAYLRYTSDEGLLVRDSCTIVNRQFVFTGNLPNATAVNIRIAEPIKFREFIYIDSGNIQINCCDSFIVTGSPLQAEADSLQNEFKEPMKRIESYIDMQRKLSTDTSSSVAAQSIALVNRELDKLIRQQDDLIIDIMIRHIKNRPSSVHSAYTLNNLLSSKRISAVEAQEMFNQFTPRNKSTYIGKEVAKELASRLGRLTIDNITFKDENDSTYQLLNIGKKKILVHFWASWCIPCIKEFPALKALLARHPDAVCVAISLDQDTAAWKKAITKYRLEKWVHSLSNSEWKKTFTNVSMPIPSSVVINKDGLILYNTLASKATLLTELEKALVQ